MSETSDIVTPTIKSLRNLGIFCERNNVRGKRSASGSIGWRRGAPDIVGYLPPRGRMFALEAKLPGARPRKDQQHQRDWAKGAMEDGVLHAVYTSPGDGVNLVLEWLKEEQKAHRRQLENKDIANSVHRTRASILGIRPNNGWDPSEPHLKSAACGPEGEGEHNDRG